MTYILLSVESEEEGLFAKIINKGSIDKLIPIMKQMAVDEFNELYFNVSDANDIEDMKKCCRLVSIDDLDSYGRITADDETIYIGDHSYESITDYTNYITSICDIEMEMEMDNRIQIMSSNCNGRKRSRLYSINVISD